MRIPACRLAMSQHDGADHGHQNQHRSLFTDYAFAFEVTSVLILVAMVGAVVLAHREPAGDKAHWGEDAQRSETRE